MRSERRWVGVGILAWLVGAGCGAGNPSTTMPTVDVPATTDAPAADGGTRDGGAGDSGAGDAGPTDGGAAGVVHVAGGSFGHTCAVLSGGGVRCWGANDNGQLGVAPADSRQQCTVPDSSPATHLPCETTPRDVPGLANVVDVAVGNGSSCALTRDGAVFCWGANDVGQLGLGSNDTSPHPAPARVTLAPARQIAMGAFHTCALLVDGTVQCWGDDEYGETGLDPAMTDADCDPGDGITSRCQRSPRAVGGLAGVTQVSAGRFHTCVLGAGGAISCWGLNSSSQLGNGRTDDTSTVHAAPVAIATPTGFTRVACGGAFTCGLRADGSVLCWGWNGAGQFGTAPTTDCQSGSSETFRCAVAPVVVPDLTGVAQLAPGRFHTCAVLRSGGVRCAGRNDELQLGLGAVGADMCSLGTDSFACTRTFSDVTIPSAREVTVGNAHSCAALVDGTVRCWGAGYYGQIGDGATTNRARPVASANLP